MLRQVLAWLIAIVVGVVLGAAAAWEVMSFGGAGLTEHYGRWAYSRAAGSTAAGPYTRAIIAREGLLALSAREARYFSLDQDEQGRPLSESCIYELNGQPLDARWWSVTIYDEAGYLVANPADIWSVNGANVTLDAKGEWRVFISPTRPADGAWLPGTKGQPFHLTLRMYNPGQVFRADPARAVLPQIVKEGC